MEEVILLNNNYLLREKKPERNSAHTIVHSTGIRWRGLGSTIHSDD